MTMDEFIKKHGLDVPECERGIAEQKAADKLKRGFDYCAIGCSERFKISDMVLITREEDPYVQLEDSRQKIRVCQPCYKNLYGDEENS